VSLKIFGFGHPVKASLYNAPGTLGGAAVHAGKHCFELLMIVTDR